MKKYKNWIVGQIYQMIHPAYFCGDVGFLIKLNEIRNDIYSGHFGIFTQLNQLQLCQECIERDGGCGGETWGDYDIEDENGLPIPGAWPLLETPRECRFKRIFFHPKLPSLRFLL